MADGRLEYIISFQADTTKAKQQMQELNQTLRTINQGINTELPFNKELKQAQSNVIKLQASLQKAVNIDTGRLDLSKFNQSLKQSNMTIDKYATSLASLGPEGQQAFAQLTRSINSAEIPVFKLSKSMDKLFVTFKNTARYQLSASIIQGFTSSLNSAFSYAKDLNASLNDIRIVTGKSIEDMSRFAVEANKAARALSTTTNEYAKASLIYYQQGLNAEAVKERTDITVKLANVTGETAQEVSDYMTAVWNNFDNGSKSLEYYADVMTKLGAATASSTDEIAAGLEKFSAIAETVGLSYEYATAALATVTSETRQSADVVGTAFKTLFGRLQGLKLGETLEDGTSLNKYSQALAAVGVNIKAQNGQLKDMDIILNELGAKWNTIGKDSQVALAQTVGGARQYNQLISLMDNWDKFQGNLNMAINSTGELQAQADIYADSWEAASNRVTSALENIYSKLIDDEFMIDATNFGADFVDGIGNVIDAFGGLKGVLLMLGALFTNIFQKQMVSGMQSFGQSIKNLIPGQKEKYLKQIEDTNLANVRAQTGGREEVSGQIKQISTAEAKAATQRAINYENMSDMDKSIIDLQYENAEHRKQQAEDAQTSYIRAAGIRDRARLGLTGQTNQQAVEYQDLVQKETSIKLASDNVLKYQKTGINTDNIKQYISELKILKTVLEDAGEDGAAALDEVNKQLDEAENTIKEINSGAINDLDDKFENLQSKNEHINHIIGGDKVLGNGDGKGLRGKIEAMETDLGVDDDQLQNLKSTAREAGAEQIGSITASQGATDAFEEVAESAEQAGQQIDLGFSASLGMGLQAITTFSMALTSLSGAFDILFGAAGQDMDFGEKLMAVIPVIASVIPMILSTSSSFMTMAKAATAAGGAQAAAFWPVTITLGAIIAALGVIIGLYKVFDMLNVSAEEKLEKAKKASQELNEELEKTKSEAEEIKQTFEGYDSAVDKLNSLTKGSKEWREQLEEVNKIAESIISDHPELLGQLNYKTNEYGMIEFDQGSMDAILEANEAKIRQAERAAAYGGINQKQAQLVYDVEQRYGGFVASDLEQKLKNGTYATEENTKALYAVKEDINALDKATKALEEIYGKQALMDAGASEEAAKVLSSEYTEAIEEAKQALKDEGWGTEGISQATVVNDEVRRIWNEYLETTGKNLGEVVDTQGDDTNRRFYYLDENNERKELSLETMIVEMAEIKASTGLVEEQSKHINSILNILENSEENKNVATALSSFLINKNFDSLTTEQAEALQDRLNIEFDDQGQAIGADRRVLSDKDLSKRISDLAETFGIIDEELETFKEVIKPNEFEDSLHDYNTAVEDAKNNLNSRKISESEYQNISNEEIQALNQLTNRVYGASQEEGIGVLNEILGQVSGEDQKNLIAYLNSMDEMATTQSQFEDKLKDFGITIDDIESPLNNFIQGLRDGAQASKNFADNLYNNSMGIRSKILAGQDISEAEYAGLSDSQKKYFEEVYGGGYRLNPSYDKNIIANEFAIQATQTYDDNINNLQNAINILQDGKLNIDDEINAEESYLKLTKEAITKRKETDSSSITRVNKVHGVQVASNDLGLKYNFDENGILISITETTLLGKPLTYTPEEYKERLKNGLAIENPNPYATEDMYSVEFEGASDIIEQINELSSKYVPKSQLNIGNDLQKNLENIKEILNLDDTLNNKLDSDGKLLGYITRALNNDVFSEDELNEFNTLLNNTVSKIQDEGLINDLQDQLSKKQASSYVSASTISELTSQTDFTELSPLKQEAYIKQVAQKEAESLGISYEELSQYAYSLKSETVSLGEAYEKAFDVYKLKQYQEGIEDIDLTNVEDQLQATNYLNSLLGADMASYMELLDEDLDLDNSDIIAALQGEETALAKVNAAYALRNINLALENGKHNFNFQNLSQSEQIAYQEWAKEKGKISDETPRSDKIHTLSGYSIYKDFVMSDDYQEYLINSRKIKTQLEAQEAAENLLKNLKDIEIETPDLRDYIKPLQAFDNALEKEKKSFEDLNKQIEDGNLTLEERKNLYNDINSNIDKQIQLTKEAQKQNRNDLTESKAWLKTEADKYGWTGDTFDEYGNFNAYNMIMEAFYNEQKVAAESGNQDAYDESKKRQEQFEKEYNLYIERLENEEKYADDLIEINENFTDSLEKFADTIKTLLEDLDKDLLDTETIRRENIDRQKELIDNDPTLTAGQRAQKKLALEQSKEYNMQYANIDITEQYNKSANTLITEGTREWLAGLGFENIFEKFAEGTFTTLENGTIFDSDWEAFTQYIEEELLKNQVIIDKYKDVKPEDLNEHQKEELANAQAETDSINKHYEVAKEERDKIEEDYKERSELELQALQSKKEEIELQKELYDEYEKLLKNIRELRDARLEYYEKIFEDDLSYAAEGFAVMVDKFGNQLTDLSTFQEQRDKIRELYAGDPDAMNEKLQELYKDTYSQLGDIQGLTKEILDYYGSVLKMTREELDKSVAHIDNIAGTLDHYKNLMDILGRSTDYEALGKILTGQAMVAANQREIEENYLAELLAQQAHIENELAKAMASGDQNMIEYYSKQVEAINTEVFEQTKKVQDAIIKEVEANKAKLENIFKELGATLEKELLSKTGVDSFSALNDSFERLKARQEEWLTETNKIYEIDKMIRTAQQASDKTDNKNSKIKLSNFIKETKSLGEKNKLSKYELELQQARYEILLAEMALEDAQRAKSKVRLQRDAEGNYGYVYTADEDTIADAEQDLADKQNALYNKQLEGAQNYTEKAYKIQEEMWNELAALNEQRMNDSTMTEEEYQRRKAEIVEYYSSQYGDYLELYGIAVSDSLAAADEAWNSSFANKTLSMKDFETATQEYLSRSEAAYTNWAETLKQIDDKYDNMFTNPENMTKGVADLVTESQALTATIKDELIPELGKELTAVDNLAKSYANLKKEMDKVVQTVLSDLDKGLEEQYDNAAQSEYDFYTYEKQYLGNGKVNVDTYKNGEFLSGETLDWETAYTMPNMKAIHKITGDIVYNEEQLNALAKTATKSSKVLSSSYEGASSAVISYAETVQKSYEKLEEFSNTTLEKIKNNFNVKGPEISQAVNGLFGAEGNISKAYSKHSEDAIKSLQNITTEQGNQIDAWTNVATTAGKKASSINSIVDELKRKFEIEMPVINGQVNGLKTGFGETNISVSDLGKYINENLIPYLQDQSEEINDYTLPALDDFKEILSDILENCKELSEIDLSDLLEQVEEYDEYVTPGATNIKRNGNQLSYDQNNGQTTIIVDIETGEIDTRYNYADKGQFATGGYTGTWGSEGKLAILHEKELVLNKQDTRNILTAVDLVRDLASQIELRAAAAQISNLSSGMFMIPNNNQTIQQEVTIHADFPGVTSSYEIEQALNNIVNKASQYVNRKF